MTTEQLLIALLRCAVNGDGAPSLTGVDWEALLELARMHRVEPLLYTPLRDAGGAPAEVVRSLKGAALQAAYQSVQLDHALSRLEAALTAAGIVHIPLRGAALKWDYPQPELRTMSDLDIIIHAEEYTAVRRAMESLGGRLVHSDGGHRTYSLPPGVTVEFHPDLIYAASPVGTAINPGWQYAAPGGERLTKSLSEEGFYLNLLCHLAYHLAGGGAGVRSVLDVWIYLDRHRPQPDRESVERELERAGLARFAQNIETLARAWFGGAPMTAEIEELGSYILECGAYGTRERHILNDACFAGKGVLGGLAGRAFYPRSEMERRYPFVKNRPWLLPAAWGLRAVRAVTRHRTQVASWLWGSAKLDSREIQLQRERLSRFGLESVR